MGRIVIPAALRGRLGLSPGMTLVVEPAQDGSVCLASAEPVLADEGGVLVVRSPAVGDLTDIVERERDRRTSEIWGEG